MNDLPKQEADFAKRLQQIGRDDRELDVPANDEQRAALRLRALAAFDAAVQSPSAPLPNLAAQQAPAAPQQHLPVPAWKQIFDQGREVMRRPIPRVLVVLAVCLVIVVGRLLIPGQESTVQAFHAFAAALVDAHSATFEMEVKIEGQGKTKLQSFYLAPGKLRNEMQGIVSVMDLKLGKSMTMSPTQKTAMVMTFQNMPKEAGKSQFNDFFERTRALLAESQEEGADHFEPLGEKQIDGRRVLGFRYASAMQVITIWGDPATGLPVQIDTLWGGLPRTEVSMANFTFNNELKPELFDTVPPADYKVQAFDVDVSKPTEATLIEALGKAADLNDGLFVDNLDTASTQSLIHKQLTGFLFALELPAAADAHYAGKGVERGTADRPIFWYKPEGKAMYRVIFADLTVKDVDQAPDVADAVRIEAPKVPVVEAPADKPLE
jgi:outer membrane lipoprotein-sorting protein